MPCPQVLTMADAPKPSVDQVKGGKVMIVKVEACSLSRGDSLMLEGSVDLVRLLLLLLLFMLVVVKYLPWPVAYWPSIYIGCADLFPQNSPTFHVVKMHADKNKRPPSREAKRENDSGASSSP